jgi:hypothetical protein
MNVVCLTSFRREDGQRFYLFAAVISCFSSMMDWLMRAYLYAPHLISYIVHLRLRPRSDRITRAVLKPFHLSDRILYKHLLEDIAMNSGIIGIALISVLIIPALLGIVFIKTLSKRELPISHYTPFDNITGHSSVEFHEEKEEHEDEDDQGDDKNKFRYKLQ